MRILLIVLLLVGFICFYNCARTRNKIATAALSSVTATETKDSTAKVEFDTQIKPILQQRCQPCHFSGGAQYARLPFDRPETIRTLGTRLFTRLKEEKEQEIIRRFLAQ